MEKCLCTDMGYKIPLAQYKTMEVNGKTTSTCVCVSLHCRDFLTSAPVVIYLTAVLLTLVYVAYEH